MKISIVTATYNVAGSLEATLASIREQTYPDLEMVIVDGGSTDGTVAIAKCFAGPNATIVSEPDKGIYDAMNKGVGLATGEYINFMNAGDRFAGDNAVAKIVDALKEQPADYVYGNVLSSFGAAEKLSIARPPAYLPKNKPFNHQSLFARRSWLQRIPFDLNYRMVADYDQTYAAYRAGASFLRLPLTVARVDMAEGASKRNYLQTMREKITVNWRRTENKPVTLVYLAGNVPYLLAIYGLRRLGLFGPVMAYLGRRKKEKT